MYTQTLKEEIVPTPQCFQLSHQVTQVFMMERKICTLFPSLGRTMPGTLLGCMAHVYRRKKKEREKIVPSLALHFQVPEGLVFSEYLVGASKGCAPCPLSGTAGLQLSGYLHWFDSSHTCTPQPLSVSLACQVLSAIHATTVHCCRKCAKCGDVE